MTVKKDFTTFPILTTTRLTLRQLTTDDREPVFDLRSDPAINKYIGRQPAKTTEDAEVFINSITEGIHKNDIIYWVITFTSNNIFAGTIGLFNFSGENNKCEIGYEVLTKLQGQGIMKEALAKVIEYAFYNLGVQSIEAFTHKDNKPSTRLIERAGFKKSPVTNTEYPDYNVYILLNLADNSQKEFMQ